ncbi:MAG: hypothetical protein LBH21_03910, partial [Gracilibacteraceae bacterium]|nr:hypothetical protein [Gracilibacteraceae bacterium]
VLLYVVICCYMPSYVAPRRYVLHYYHSSSIQDKPRPVKKKISAVWHDYCMIACWVGFID